MDGRDDELSFLEDGQNRFVRIQREAGRRIDELLSDMCGIGPMAEDALRSTVMERYGLGRDDALYLIEMAREADAEAVERDKQALKRAFTYRDCEHDLWEVLLEDCDRPFFAPLRIAGLPLLGAAGFVVQCYYEKGALGPLVRKYCGYDQWSPDDFDPLLQRLDEAGRFDLVERLCTSVARRARSRFFSERRRRDSGPGDAWLEKYKDYALEAYDRSLAWTSRLGLVSAGERLAGEREEVREERLPQLPPVSDPRRIDEPVFWEIVSSSRAQAETLDDQLAALDRLLASFDAADIKRFGALYAGYMRKLYHWNAWALAYAARDGCSDDSFMAFRTWLILQADLALVELAVADPVRAALKVPREPELPDGTLMSMLEEAYLRRRGAPLKLPAMDHSKPKGREWPEDELEAIFPDLVAHYRSVEAYISRAESGGGLAAGTH